MIGLESCFGAVNKVLCIDNNTKIEKVSDSLTLKPRKIMGFNADLFSLNSRAEVTILNANQKWNFSLKDIESKSVNSPFIGKQLTGKVLYTISKNFLATI